MALLYATTSLRLPYSQDLLRLLPSRSCSLFCTLSLPLSLAFDSRRDRQEQAKSQESNVEGTNERIDTVVFLLSPLLSPHPW